MIHKTPHGTTKNGEKAFLYTLEAGPYTATISTYGGTIVSLIAPDRDGKPGDVVLGYRTLGEYEQSATYFGALIGRFANRIAQGMFTLDGKTYLIPTNDGGVNALHGGTVGFDKRLWSALTSEVDGAPGLHLSLHSPDGEMGFPGNMRVYVDYLLRPAGELVINYAGTVDHRCPVNLTNHAYFNLAAKGDILAHRLRLACDRYLPVNRYLIPTGEIAYVGETPFDFTEAKPIGRDIGQVGGYDHCMVLDGKGEQLKECAYAEEPGSGRTLTVLTTMEAVQFYSGNFLGGGDIGKDGKPYRKHGGFCLETQHYPDAMNHPNFPTCILEPGESFRHTTVYRFGVMR